MDRAISFVEMHKQMNEDNSFYYYYYKSELTDLIAVIKEAGYSESDKNIILNISYFIIYKHTDELFDIVV